MNTITVSATKLKASWTSYLEQVKNGLVIVVTRRGKPEVAMIPFSLYQKLQEEITTGSLNKIGSALKQKGTTLEELMDSGRDIRGKIVEEEYGLKSNQ